MKDCHQLRIYVMALAVLDVNMVRWNLEIYNYTSFRRSLYAGNKQIAFLE